MGAETALGALQKLTSITRLDLDHNQLASLPKTVAALPLLAHLDLGFNDSFAGEGALRPLQHCTQLTRLGLGWCGASPCLLCLPAACFLLSS